MTITNVKINEIKKYDKNAKDHSTEQINAVAESISQFGFVQPIVIDENNTIIIGHCRYMAAKKLKMIEVPCVLVDDLTQEQVNALRLADNKTNESEWNLDNLAECLENITDIDMSLFGFNENDDQEKKDRKDHLLPTDVYECIVECSDETNLQEVFEQLTKEGYICRISTL
jgi:ParB/RepB/Spo0J family partition protein